VRAKERPARVSPDKSSDSEMIPLWKRKTLINLRLYAGNVGRSDRFSERCADY
jgi:hypothetical protein